MKVGNKISALTLSPERAKGFDKSHPVTLLNVAAELESRFLPCLRYEGVARIQYSTLQPRPVAQHPTATRLGSGLSRNHEQRRIAHVGPVVRSFNITLQLR